MAAAAASLVAAAPLIAAQPAFAQYPPAPNLTIEDADLVLEPGQVVEFLAQGFQPNERVTGRLVPIGGGGAGAGGPGGAAALGRSATVPQTFTAARPKPSPSSSPSPSPTTTMSTGDDERFVLALGHWTANANGVVDSTVAIPKGTPEGAYYLRLIGEDSGLILSVRVTVD
ncbi:hypothetical protein ACFQ6Q_06300, partial [Streptomyces sp. NPDC056437]